MKFEEAVEVVNPHNESVKLEFVRQFKQMLDVDDQITDPDFPSERANKLYK